MFNADKDYKNISNWWKARAGWEPVPLDMLPKFGIIAHDNEHDYCAIWLYPMSGGLGMMEWLVSNPESPQKVRRESLGFILEGITDVAKHIGITRIFSTLKHERLEKLYQEKGFKITDTGVTHFMKEVE